MELGEKITDTLVAIFHLDRGNRQRNYGYFEGILSIIINVILFGFKFVMAAILNSISLKTDALNNLTDVFSSVMVIVGFTIAAKPADSKHPFGHGRAERILSILIAAILVFVGLECFISSYNRFRNPIPIEAGLITLILLCISILAKEFLVLIAFNLGKKISAASLKADAWNHRSDSIATSLIVIAFLLFKFGLFRLDGILGMAVSALIVYTGIKIIIESGSSLIGEQISPKTVKQIIAIAASFDFVKNVHHIHVHDYGGNLEITLHIMLKKDLHLSEVHKKATAVEQAIREAIPGSEVTVHTEPMYK